MNIRSFCILEREQRAHPVSADSVVQVSVNERQWTDTIIVSQKYLNFPFRHYEAERDAWEDQNH